MSQINHFIVCSDDESVAWGLGQKKKIMLHKSTNVNDVNESIKIERLKQITLARGEKEDIARERGGD